MNAPDVTRTDWVWARRYEILGLLGVAMAFESIRLFLVSETSSRMADDAHLVWKPLSEAVLSGTPLYIGAVDNKPPLWLAQQVLASATGHYLAVNLLLVGVTNAAIAICLWYLLDRYRPDRNVGLLAGVLFLVAVPIIAAAISNKNAGILFVLIALTQTRPERVGAAVALAGLFAQQAILAIPAVVYIAGRNATSPARWIGYFVTAGLGVVGLAYGVVGAIWGPAAAVRGVELAAGLATPTGGTSSYLLGGLGRQESLLVNPVGWVYAMYVVVRGIFFLLVPAILGGLLAVRRRGSPEQTIARDFLLLGALLSVSLAIRPFRNYWILLLPSLSVLAALGYLRIAERGRELVGANASPGTDA